MEKDFDTWNTQKKDLDGGTPIPFYFKEGDVWWASTGINVGFEENGKGTYFRRPVLIIRKFNQNLTYTVPLTSKIGLRPYHIPCLVSDGIERQAIVSQCKSMSSKRFSNKISSVGKMEMEKIKNAVKESLSGIPEISSGADSSATEPEGHL
jgi:mRNA interferase MazF